MIMADSANSTPKSVSAERYACPKSHAPLNWVDSSLCTASGNARYPVNGAIPNFLQFEAAAVDPAAEQVKRANGRAPVIGWRSALEETYGPQSWMMRYVAGADRASFLSLLPLTKESKVLEIGPGLGQFTSLLAARAKSVCALEVVPEQAQFVAERCRQEGATNVQVAVGGDDCRLPYPDNTFDITVLNLVFEWCASRCVGEEHEAVQRRLLSEINRVLRPNGTLYLATKNRFALSYLMGKRDEHFANLRFGSALPRSLGRLLARAIGVGRTPGWLHSHDRLQVMLHQAGFGSAESYWAAPEMRFPSRYVRTTPAQIRAARADRDFVQGEYAITRSLMRWIPAAFVRHVTSGLTFVARKCSS